MAYRLQLNSGFKFFPLFRSQTLAKLLAMPFVTHTGPLVLSLSYLDLVLIMAEQFTE